MPDVLPLAYSDPFATGTLRTYLAVHLVGPNGAEGDVLGIVDSGADSTCLPRDFAALMGYAAGDLEEKPMVQAGGATTCWVPKQPSTAWVVGLEDRPFSFEPTFMDGALSVLWGRADLFQEFGIVSDEPSKHFSPIVPD